jgi:predicted lipid-binding transport protein (Tim44 family)
MTAAATAGGMDMTSKAHRIEIGALCTAAILICLWGIVWDITSGLITSGIDGIMLLLISLMIAGIFSAMFAHMLWQAGLIPFLKPAPAAPPAKAAAPAAKPAATAATPAAAAAPPKPPAAPAVAPNAPAATAAAPASPAPKPAPAASPTTPSTTPGEPPTK